MWRILFSVIFLANVFISQPVQAQDPSPPTERLAECDLCGYCPNKNFLPSNWGSCQVCLYPSAAPSPQTNDTLRIDPAVNSAPTPKPGHYYTMIGCLKTDLGDFTGTNAAGNVVQSLLNLLFKVAGGIAFLYLMYGSFLIITSQGNTEKLNYGRRVVVGAIIGLAFSLSSLFIINLLASNILKIPGFNSVTPTPSP